MTFDILGDGVLIGNRQRLWPFGGCRQNLLLAGQDLLSSCLGWHTGFSAAGALIFRYAVAPLKAEPETMPGCFCNDSALTSARVLVAGATMLVNHTDTLIRACVDGVGISSQSIDLVANHLHSGELQRVLSPWITGTNTLYVVLPSRKFIPKRASVFLKFTTGYTRTVIKKMEERAK